jgi:signal transduction histidine kinase
LLLLVYLAATASPFAQAENATNDLSRWRMIDVPKDATNGLGGWIWSAQTTDKQFCQLWRAFEIPPGARVSQALLKMTVDNGYRFFLDGRELGQGTEWRALTQYDITLLLTPGTHTLAVIGFNDFLQAGLILGLRVELVDGRVIEVKSDASWRIVPNDESGWEFKKQAAAGWASAKVAGPHDLSPLWWTDHPLDFATVAPFKPVIIPLWHRGWFHAALISVCGIIFLICLWLMAQLIVRNNEHRLLNLERARIARDIHDDVGTRLTKLVLQGEVVQSTQPANSEVRRQLDMICEGLRGVLGAMDEVLWAVNPRHDTLENFISYLCDYAETFLQNTKIQCRLDVEADLPPLNFDLPLRRSLLLVVKEALNNAAKYSGASELILRVYRNGQKLVVVVEDNGKGFDLNQARPDRNGLTNLFQRMKEAGGECQIKTRPGAGCRVEFSLPLTGRPVRHWFVNRSSSPEPDAHSMEQRAAAPENREPPRN